MSEWNIYESRLFHFLDFYMSFQYFIVNIYYLYNQKNQGFSFLFYSLETRKEKKSGILLLKTSLTRIKPFPERSMISLGCNEGYGEQCSKQRNHNVNQSTTLLSHGIRKWALSISKVFQNITMYPQNSKEFETQTV